MCFSKNPSPSTAVAATVSERGVRTTASRVCAFIKSKRKKVQYRWASLRCVWCDAQDARDSGSLLMCHINGTVCISRAEMSLEHEQASVRASLHVSCVVCAVPVNGRACSRDKRVRFSSFRVVMRVTALRHCTLIIDAFIFYNLFSGVFVYPDAPAAVASLRDNKKHDI